MGITGQLRTMGFGDLMQWLASSEKTGALIVEGVKHSKKLFFRRGLIKKLHTKGLKVFEKPDLVVPTAPVVNRLDDPLQLDG